MKLNIIKDHHFYPKGVADVPEGRANYLISIGVAEKVMDLPIETPEKSVIEKEEMKPGGKAKKENKIVSPAKNIK